MFISFCTVFTVYLIQLAALCQQFLKEMCYVLCYVMSHKYQQPVHRYFVHVL